MGQSVAQSHGVLSVQHVPHILLGIDVHQRHVYQGNILQCPGRHPLITRALSHAMQTSPEQLLRCRRRFRQYMWDNLTADLGSPPVHGWNWTPTFGPVYLFQEVLLPEPEREYAVTSEGGAVSIDGHVMILDNDLETQFAATRAWGRRHRFRELQLMGAAARAETRQQAAAAARVDQSVAQVLRRHGVAAGTSAVAPIAVDQSVAQVALASAVDAAASTDTENAAAADEAEGVTAAAATLESDISIELVEVCRAMVTRLEHYSDLQVAELEILMALGLRPVQGEEEGFFCSYCRNNRRKEELFDNLYQIRNHFEHNHELPEHARIPAVDLDDMNAAMADFEEAGRNGEEAQEHP
eukprot:s556_g26.t1